MFLELFHHFQHHRVSQMTLTFNVKNIGPLFGLGGSRIDSRQTDTILSKGRSSPSSAPGRFRARPAATSYRYRSEELSPCPAPEIVWCYWSCRLSRQWLESMQSCSQLAGDGRYTRLTPGPTCRFTIAGDRLPGDVREMAIQPVAALPQRLLMPPKLTVRSRSSRFYRPADDALWQLYFARDLQRRLKKQSSVCPTMPSVEFSTGTTP